MHHSRVDALWDSDCGTGDVGGERTIVFGLRMGAGADEVSLQRPEVLDESLNHCGRTRAMTVFSMVRPWYRPPGGALVVRVIFWFARRLLQRDGGTATIAKLSFIHFARWGLIERMPDLGQPRETLRQPLFMFESNYNGTFDQYIDAFANILTTGMRVFWCTSYGFPTPKPVMRFMSYIHANEYVAQHYYSAYPTATATMVVAALELDPTHREFHRAASSMQPEEFAERFAVLMAAEQGQR